jgi:plasmid stabilization system protein ParE
MLWAAFGFMTLVAAIFAWLWRQAERDLQEVREGWTKTHEGWAAECAAHNALRAKYARLTDRDEKGRFVRKEGDPPKRRRG